MVYIALWKQEKMLVYLKKQALIEDKALIRALIFDEALTVIPAEYCYYSNIFLLE